MLDLQLQNIKIQYILTYKKLPKVTLDHIRSDLAIEQKDSNSDFIILFPTAFLSFLHKLLDQQNANLIGFKKNIKLPEPQSVQDLFGQSFFPYDFPVFKKHSVLEAIVQNINSLIHKFYMLKKGRLQELISVIKEKKMSSDIQYFIDRRRNDPIGNKIRIIESSESPEFQKEIASDVITVKNDSYDSCPHCLCSRSTLNVGSFQQTQKSARIQCRSCSQNFHTVCLKISNPNYRQFICPECILKKMDLLNTVIEVLCEPVPFQPTNHTPLKALTFKMKQKQVYQAVEIRCIKLDGKTDSEEPTWPDIGELILNGRKVFEFRPLQQNSSIKKRRDEKYTTEDLLYNSLNTVVMKQGIPTQDQKMNCRVQLKQQSFSQVYFLGVYLVKKQTPETLVKEIKENQYSWLSMENAKKFIQLYVKQTGSEDEVSIESLLVTFICQFDTRLIETPARLIKGEVKQPQLKQILNEKETLKLFPKYTIKNDNRVYQMEGIQKKMEVPRALKNQLVKGFRLNKRVIEVDVDEEEEKGLEPELRKRQCLQKLLSNYNIDVPLIVGHYLGKQNKQTSKGITHKDPIFIE